jgi:hypothetical protein
MGKFDDTCMRTLSEVKSLPSDRRFHSLISFKKESSISGPKRSYFSQKKKHCKSHKIEGKIINWAKNSLLQNDRDDRMSKKFTFLNLSVTTTHKTFQGKIIINLNEPISFKNYSKIECCISNYFNVRFWSSQNIFRAFNCFISKFINSLKFLWSNW